MYALESGHKGIYFVVFLEFKAFCEWQSHIGLYGVDEYL